MVEVEVLLYFGSIHLLVISSTSPPNFINVEIHVPRKLVWQLTGFYGFPEHERNSES